MCTDGPEPHTEARTRVVGRWLLAFLLLIIALSFYSTGLLLFSERWHGWGNASYMDRMKVIDPFIWIGVTVYYFFCART